MDVISRVIWLCFNDDITWSNHVDDDTCNTSSAPHSGGLGRDGTHVVGVSLSWLVETLQQCSCDLSWY
jgi:hypothetical protein